MIFWSVMIMIDMREIVASMCVSHSFVKVHFLVTEIVVTLLTNR